MSKELQEILQSNVDVLESDDILKNGKILVAKKEYRCSILSISISDYSFFLKAKANKETCLSLLRSKFETKIQLPEILPNKNNFILSGIEIEEGWVFKLTATITNI
jgi:hypothetical protein